MTEYTHYSDARAASDTYIEQFGDTDTAKVAANEWADGHPKDGYVVELYSADGVKFRGYL